MAFNDSKETASNDEAMWDSYHTGRLGAAYTALNTLKTTLVCKMFASKILGMSGPVQSVLELGCGTASTLAMIQRMTGARCVGIDRSSEAVRIANQKHPEISVETGDIFNLPYPPGSFDLVYSVGLFEHFTKPEQRRLLEIHGSLAQKYVAMMVPANGILMNSILFVNKRIRKKTGTWADEEVFSPRLLSRHFPEYRFDGTFDWRFGNLIMWFGWQPQHGPA
jgi:SAM-dependent methyltransferase